MTEREILDRQEQTGNREYYLVLIGSFMHAYGHGAFGLARATGYRVMRKQRKWGEVLTTGFPANRLDQVRLWLREAGGELEKVDDKTYLFRGIDGTPDPQMVSDPVPVSALSPKRGGAGSPLDWLADAVRGYNLSLSTPMDAIMFIGTLQQRLKENDDACESPAG